MAVHESFGSFIAQVTEVSAEAGRIRVHRVTCAVECGIAINPSGIAAQMGSGIASGLGAALHSRLTFKDGRVQQSNYRDCEVLRMHEMPAVEGHIVPSTGKSGGVGEPGGERAPVSVPHDRFAAQFKAWRDAGAPFPQAG